MKKEIRKEVVVRFINHERTFYVVMEHVYDIIRDMDTGWDDLWLCYFKGGTWAIVRDCYITIDYGDGDNFTEEETKIVTRFPYTHQEPELDALIDKAIECDWYEKAKKLQQEIADKQKALDKISKLLNK